MPESPILVTGSAGFIGAAVSARLLADGHRVCGLDNFNPYYDVRLKEARAALLRAHPAYIERRVDLADRSAVAATFSEVRPGAVVHLAAQAGVRHSITHPDSYADSNLLGQLNVLEGCRHTQTAHLVFASTSAVYGANTILPFRPDAGADHPISLYAATKRAGELMAHSYAHLYQLPVTALRLFTVYGPWGRPDMALFRFTRAMLTGEPIQVYDHGRHRRDFTYVDDVVEGMVRVLAKPPHPEPAWDGAHPDPASSAAPFKIYNLGHGHPVPLLRYIRVLEQCLGRKAVLEMLPAQPGDMPDTAADISGLAAAVAYSPSTPVEVGVQRFVDWYRSYYAV